MRVLLRVAAPWLLTALLLFTGAARLCAEFDSEDFVSVDELAVGDLCVGRTVLAGSEVEEFEIEIVGVVRGVGPESDLIIGRAHGEVLEKTGIMQGMSGSPVYLNGRLVGAIAGTWPYTKEPIASITPIGEMLPALDALEARTGERPGMGNGGAYGSLLFPGNEFASSRIGWITRSAGRAAPPAAPGTDAEPRFYGGRELAPLACPLVVSGGDERFLRRTQEIIGEWGFAPVRAASSGEAVAAAEIEPGSSVGIQFVRGSLNWAAIGTVTYRDGQDILAFGHPVFDAGAVEAPMVGAYVHTLMPLQSVSFKFASGTELVGTFMQDRRRVVAGRLGPPPSMMPLSVNVEEDGYGSRTYEFEVIRSRPYGSIFSGLAVSGAVAQALKSVGPSSIDLTVRLTTGDDVIDYATTFYTSDPAFRAGGELSSLMDLVLENEFEERGIDEVRLEVAIRPERRTAVIERVEANRGSYEPGDEVVARVTLRKWKGEREVRTVSLSIPRTQAEGPVLLRVGGPESYHAWEADRLGSGLAPRSFEQLLGLVDRSKPGNVVTAQLLVEQPGLSLEGRELRGLPGKAALAMASTAVSGAVDPTELGVVAEDELVLDRDVVGYHELRLIVKTKK